MKLISVRVLGNNFRSLAANKLYEFNVIEREGRLSTKVFAGLNGSGKSNFLELLSEIFYYLELYNLSKDKDNQNLALPFGFEIEYLLPKSKFSDSNDIVHIRVTKQPYELPEFSKKELGEKSFARVDAQVQVLLPTKVIAYTSGQNELLSNPYYKIKYNYFNQFEKKRIEESQEVSSDINRLFFIDYAVNFSIFISNMLLADRVKLDYINEILGVRDLNSFRVTINFLDFNKKRLPGRWSFERNVNKLKLCATSWFRKGRQLILDYKVNSATKEAFRFHFHNAFTLFKAFYEMEVLNLYTVSPRKRRLIANTNKSFNISDELSKADPSELVFRLEKIKLNKITGDALKIREIYYKGLSDGEHQFNEVIGSILMMEEEGCLFLMDEPDTHFNPQWRAKMIEVLNFVTATSFDDKDKVKSVRNQEIIITTHSPFIISDSQREDVYKFTKVGSLVQFESPKHIETYGAEIGLVLQEIFDRQISISEFSNSELEELRNEFVGLKDKETIIRKVAETKARLVDFGESIEKFDLYNFLRQIEKEIALIK